MHGKECTAITYISALYHTFHIATRSTCWMRPKSASTKLASPWIGSKSRGLRSAIRNDSAVSLGCDVNGLSSVSLTSERQCTDVARLAWTSFANMERNSSSTGKKTLQQWRRTLHRIQERRDEALQMSGVPADVSSSRPTSRIPASA